MQMKKANSDEINALQRQLGFRVVTETPERGWVQYLTAEGHVITQRPATPQEIKMFGMLAKYADVLFHGVSIKREFGVPAETVVDPLGTPKESGQ